MPGRLYVFALECVCSWFIGFGSSLVSGESVNSVTDGSHSKKAQTPLVADQAFCFVFFLPLTPRTLSQAFASLIFSERSLIKRKGENLDFTVVFK